MEHTSADFESHTLANPVEPVMAPPQAAPSAPVDADSLRTANEKLHAELERLRADLAGQRDAMKAERETWTTEQQSQGAEESKQAAADDDSADPSADPEECRAARSGRSSFRHDDDDRERNLVPGDPSREDRNVQAEGGKPASARGHEEESIESYMAALLTRMRGGEGPSTVAAEPPRRGRRKSDRVPPQDQPSIEPAKTERPPDPPVVVLPKAPPEFAPRPRMEISDLAAMRELANAQARLAIHVHGRKQLVNIMLIRSAAAAGSLVASFVALRLWPFDHEILFGCGMAGIVAGIYWMFLAAGDAQKFLNWFESRETQSSSGPSRSQSSET